MPQEEQKELKEKEQKAELEEARRRTRQMFEGFMSRCRTAQDHNEQSKTEEEPVEKGQLKTD